MGTLQETKNEVQELRQTIPERDYNQQQLYWNIYFLLPHSFESDRV